MISDNGLASAYTQLLLQNLNGEWPELRRSSVKGSIQDCADGALDALRCIANLDLLPGVSGSALLTERAKLLGFGNPGQVSANGTCRMMQTRTGWIALNLAREEDWELMPAWLEAEAGVGDWQSIDSRVRSRSGAVLVDRGRLMGLPVTVLDSYHVDSWYRSQMRGPHAAARRKSPLVIDLSSLWAGPLCSHLLLQAGATVIKVESSRRPDSTRVSSPEFHELINSGKYSVMLDLKNTGDISKLAKLLRQADIVIESARPRALRHMGIDPESMVDQVPGLTWVSITGYGRSEPEANWVAFGDDAAIAAGAALVRDNGPGFVGDAVSDPLTGIHAAIAALAGWQSGAGRLIDISLAGVTSFALRTAGSAAGIDLEADFIPRTVAGTAPALGHDTGKVFKEFVDPCC
jgi:hypothetical protein